MRGLAILGLFSLVLAAGCAEIETRTLDAPPAEQVAQPTDVPAAGEVEQRASQPEQNPPTGENDMVGSADTSEPSSDSSKIGAQEPPVTAGVTQDASPPEVTADPDTSTVPGPVTTTAPEQSTTTTLAEPVDRPEPALSPTTTMPSPGATTTTEPPSDPWRSEMLLSLNEIRAGIGLNPLVMCQALERASQDYSAVLMSWGKIDHIGPDGSTVPQRAEAAGYLGWNGLAENLAAGQQDVASVMAAWMESEGHRRNIEHPMLTHVGFGRSDGAWNGYLMPYWVQNFGSGGQC